MKLKKLITLGILLTMTAAFMTGCGTGSEAGEPGTQADTGTVQSEEESTEDSEETDTDNLKVVHIATPGIDAEGNAALQEGAAIAQKKGFFEEELNAVGYTAEYVGFATQGVGINEALTAGEADIALYGDFPVITYLATGNDGQIIGLNSTRVQIGIYASDEIQSPEDLKGKKIGTVLGTSAYKYLVYYLEQNGLSVDDVEIVNASSELASLFLSGEVDAIAQSTLLFYSIKEQGAGHVLAVNGDDESLAAYYAILGRKEFLDENPEVAQAVLKAIERATEYAEENKEETFEILAGLSGYYTADVYKDYYSFRDSLEYWDPELKDENIAKLQETADFMYENGYIANQITIEDYIRR